MNPVTERLRRLLRRVGEQALPASALASLDELHAAAGDGAQALHRRVTQIDSSDFGWIARYLTLAGRIERLTGQVEENAPDPIETAFAAYETPEQLAKDLARLRWIPVFTLHPSEIIPCAVIDQLACLANDADHWCETNARGYESIISDRLSAMLQQEPVSTVRPTVDDEVDWLIRVFERTVFGAVSAHFKRLEDAARNRFGSAAPAIPTYLRFHSWVGGDRDGNPNVTPASTKRATDKMRHAVLMHYRTMLAHIIGNARSDDNLRDMLAHLETRLYATANRQPSSYRSAGAMRGDIRQAMIAAEQAHDQRCVDGLWQLLRSCDVFGLHLAGLEWRQDSMFIRELLQDLGDKLGHDCLVPIGSEAGLSERCRDLVESLRTLAIARHENGPDAVSELILANTTDAVEILTLSRLARECGVFDMGVVPVVPLFETLSALRNAPAIMEALLADRNYRADLAEMGNRAEIMLGYSDSAKDGGRLAADTMVYEAQEALQKLFAERAPEIDLIFFHGRGGSLGRGVATPRETAGLCPSVCDASSLKQTEQGESLSLLYGSQRNASDHMGDTFAALLRHSKGQTKSATDFKPLMHELTELGSQTYRSFIQHPDFIGFLSNVTPLSEISALPITSRPARRQGIKLLGLENLRAVSYNFAFNQAASQVPAWYGTGTALATILEGPQADILRRAAQEFEPLKLSLKRAAAALAGTRLEYLAEKADTLDEANGEHSKAIMHLLYQEQDRLRKALVTLDYRAEPKDGSELLIALTLQSHLLHQQRKQIGEPAHLRGGIAAVAAWMMVTG